MAKKISIFISAYLLVGLVIAFITKDNDVRLTTIFDWPIYIFSVIGWILGGAQI